MSNATFLQGERVTLRPAERDDAAFLQRAYNDAALRRPLGFTRPANESQTADAIERRAENEDTIELLVCVDDEPAGSVRLEQLSWTRPILSYWLVPEQQGAGYATEAVTLVIDYVFETFEKRGLYAFTTETNEPSQRLLERLGFVQEGRFRADRFEGGEYVDSIHFGLLREEWVDGE